MTRHVIRLVALSVMLLITAAAADVIAQTGDPGTLSIARQGYLFAGGKYATVNGRRVLRERRFAAPERYNDWPQARLHTQWPGKGAPGDPIFDQFLASQMPGIPDFTLQQVLNRDEILALLEKHKYVGSVEKRGKKVRKFLDVALLYNKDGDPAVSGVKRVSKSSRRVYATHDKLYLVKQGYGIAVISTSKGIMTGGEAKKAGLGGEVIAEVW